MSTIVLTDSENAHIDECYEFILDLVRVAGKEVCAGFAELSKAVGTKTGSWDLVTEYDARVERILIDAITANYSHHR